jgi:hypothetical protein
MISPQVKLFRLRGIFIVYFLAKSLVGTAVAWSVLRLADPGVWRAHANFHELRPGSVVLIALTGIVLVLALAWLIFGQLLQRKNWARVLLLVIGWLTVISAVFTLLASPRIAELGSWLSRLAPVTAGMDWQKLLQYDRIQKVLELFFWGYLIWVLQFDQAVRDEFFPPEPGEQAPGK